MPLETGAQVGRYRVVRLLAQGGMAEVYRAEQELTAGFFRQVALKIIRPEYAESKDFRAMFLDEARTACGLSHPNIVPIYEVDEADGSLFMAMELVPGETLARVGRLLREAGKAFTPEALLAVGIATCSALEAVHALSQPGEGNVNLVHRDVSPHNLLLSPQGNLKLIDFGIAKAVTNRNLTMPGVVKGKAGYFSPEQAMGLPLDGRSDLFSVGVTLYKLAYGNTPFDAHETVDARNTALLNGQWKPLEEVQPGLPEGLYAVLRKALQVKAQDRYPTAKEMREALERVAVENGIHVGPSSLEGYVTADQEELSVVSTTSRVESGAEGSTVRLGDGPAPRPPAVPAAPPPPPPDEVVGDSTMVLQKPAEAAAEAEDTGLPLWIVGAGVGLGAAFVGAATVLVVFGGTVAQPPPPAAPAPAPVPVVVVAPPPEPSPATEPAPAEPGPPGPAPAALPAAGSAPEKAAEPAKGTAGKAMLVARMEAAAVEPKAPEPPRPEPVPAPVAVAPVLPRPAPEPKPAAAAKEEPIPEGTGTLRVGSEPLGLKVRVAGNELETPGQVKLASGRYTVEFTSADGVRGECRVKVLPDQTAKVRFSADGKRCE